MGVSTCLLVRKVSEREQHEVRGLAKIRGPDHSTHNIYGVSICSIYLIYIHIHIQASSLFDGLAQADARQQRRFRMLPGVALRSNSKQDWEDPNCQTMKSASPL